MKEFPINYRIKHSLKHGSIIAHTDRAYIGGGKWYDIEKQKYVGVPWVRGTDERIQEHLHPQNARR